MTLVAPQLQQHRDIADILRQISAQASSTASTTTQAGEIRRQSQP